MSETKWTPGPYEVAERGTYPDDEGHKILGPQQKNSKGRPVRHYMAQFVKSEAEANLFAAAPELYEAAALLEELELSRQDCPECEGIGEAEACPLCFPKADDARIKRRAALAKARGETEEIVKAYTYTAFDGHPDHSGTPISLKIPDSEKFRLNEVISMPYRRSHVNIIGLRLTRQNIQSLDGQGT